MNQNDRQLILNLSDRLKQTQVSKDPEAADFIDKNISSQPNAIYVLTQAVLVQEAAIKQLQEQMAELQAQAQPKRGFFSSFLGGNNNMAYQTPPPRTSPFGQGSFLGSMLTTAAGVAGGMFLFEGISHLFSGGQNSFLEDGFGTGDSFLNDSSGDFGGGFDDGFGGDGSNWF